MKGYKQLDVWQASMRLAKWVYRLTKTFPKEEAFGMTSQLRRASVSIPSNIAEGASRHTKKDFAQFVSIARGSCAELETLIELSIDFELLPADPDLEASISDVARMLRGLGNSLRAPSRAMG